MGDIALRAGHVKQATTGLAVRAMMGAATRLRVAAPGVLAVSLGVLVLCIGLVPTARADTFTATYKELARSPAGHATTWYSGAVTNDSRFIYGMGHSHASYGNNGLWTYDPATNTHKSVLPDTGNFWRWDKDATGKLIHETGRWAKLDPVANKALFEFFGGPDIVAMTNRNNHQAFYMPGVDQFWVMAGTTFSEASPYMFGRFSLATNRWVYVSKPWGDPTKNDLVDFSAGMIAGQPAGWAAPNAATAVCKDIDTAVLFGGMADTWGAVRVIEPNPAGPEHYRWANAPKAPIYLPAENVRHNAACVGDTVYFVSGQERVPNTPTLRTPDPAPFWKFHVPTRTWTKLTPGPVGSYFTVMTYDSGANALLVYGGSHSNRLWAYDLAAGAWQNLTGTVPNLPWADMHTGGFMPGFGHVYKGGKRYDATGKDLGYSVSAQMMEIVLRRVPGASPPVAKAVAKAPLAQRDTGNTQQPAMVAVPNRDQPIAKRVRDREQAGRPNAPTRVRAASVASPSPHTQVATAGIAIAWTKLPLPGQPNSPQGSMKHQRLVEGPGGRVYLLGGDWGGAGGENSGRQEVYSFDPLSTTGDWRQEAPYCGTVQNPVHWHTDEAGPAWDAKRGIFWKLSGTEYGPDDACLTAGKSVKAKVITFDPASRLWTVPAGFSQKRFGYVTNGVLDPTGDQMVQITDKTAFHLSLAAGTWASYPLPGDVVRFNALTIRIGRTVWWLNRREQLEAYNLDTHALTQHGQWPFPAQDGWATAMTMAYGDKVLTLWPTARADTLRHAALYDPAAKTWQVIEQGEGWGNAGLLHSSGKLILMGGGIDGPEYINKQVWVGTIKP